MMKYGPYLVMLLALLCVLGYAGLSGYAIYIAFARPSAAALPEAFLHTATALGGLIGGIVAVGFGQSPPPKADPSKNQFTRNVRGVAMLINPLPEAPAPPAVAGANRADAATNQIRDSVGLIYAIVYILVGAAAIFTCVVVAKPPDLVKSEAAVSLGLFIPVVAAFFKDN